MSYVPPSPAAWALVDPRSRNHASVSSPPNGSSGLARHNDLPFLRHVFAPSAERVLDRAERSVKHASI